MPTEQESIRCPRCGRTSYNHNDVINGYCGFCHEWTGLGNCAGCGQPLSSETGWATAKERYCFKPQCQQVFLRAARELVRQRDPELADRMAG